MPANGIVVSMTKRTFARNVVAAAMLAGAGTAVTAPLVSAQVLAPAEVRDRVTDESGVLSRAQAEELNAKITQIQSETQRILYVVYVPSFGGQDAESFARSIVNSRGENTAALVVATDDRLGGVFTGSQWSNSEREAMWDAAYSSLAGGDWGAAGLAAADAALGNGSGAGANGGSGGGAGWLAAGGAAVVAAGGGIWAVNRRKTKKNQKEVLESARQIEPGNTGRLASLDLETLDKLAHEELSSTDESIRRGKEELDIAIAEFGPERARPFIKAMNHSTTTLQRAFSIRQQLDDAIPESPEQRRQMLVEIVSSCGKADDALDAQATQFAEMRNLLVNASSTLDELTQRTVDLRARLPLAEQTLGELTSRYAESMLRSVADNAEMAKVSLEEAERNIETGRGLLTKPAGEQGGLVGAIRDAERAAELTDKLLSGIEHAETNIGEAKATLAALIAEVDGEINEARELEGAGKANGTDADWAQLEDVVSRAETAVAEARSNGETDPLGSHTALTTIDSELDDQLDRVRAKTADRARALEMHRQQMSSAQSQIQQAEDVIASRGRIIGATARTKLATAKRGLAMAMQTQGSDIRLATEYARQATQNAQSALHFAHTDIEHYRSQQRARQRASTGGDLITGMVLGSILGGGGGFGGGFGGGGGGFSGGGGGGGFTGGAF